MIFSSILMWDDLILIIFLSFRSLNLEREREKEREEKDKDKVHDEKFGLKTSLCTGGDGDRKII